jgi:hypothetical protein
MAAADVPIKMPSIPITVNISTSVKPLLALCISPPYCDHIVVAMKWLKQYPDHTVVAIK